MGRGEKNTWSPGTMPELATGVRGKVGDDNRDESASDFIRLRFWSPASGVEKHNPLSLILCRISAWWWRKVYTQQEDSHRHSSLSLFLLLYATNTNDYVPALLRPLRVIWPGVSRPANCSIQRLEALQKKKINKQSISLKVFPHLGFCFSRMMMMMMVFKNSN